MQPDDIRPDLALGLLLNSGDIVARLPEMDEGSSEIEEIKSALQATSEKDILRLGPPLVSLLLDAEPTIARDLDTLSQRFSTRGVESDPSMVAGLWETLKADVGYIALLVFFLRTLGYNKIKTKLGEYEGHSVYDDLRSLIRPARSSSSPTRKK
jgi:hypothetical protein